MTRTNTTPGVTVATKDGQVRLTSGRLELTILTAANQLDACALRDRSTGAVFADAPYVWPGDVPPTLVGEPRVKRDNTGAVAVTIEARLGDLAIEQTFETRPESPDAIFEIIALRNTGSKTIENRSFHCGFAKAIKRGNDWMRDADAVQFCGIPYRRDTDGVVRDFPLRRPNSPFAQAEFRLQGLADASYKVTDLDTGATQTLAANHEFTVAVPTKPGSAVFVYQQIRKP